MLWKKTAPVALLVATAFLTAPSLYAGGYETFGLGARAGAMGGAFIGLADDWTASYWNPAGLAQLQGRAVGVDLLTPHVTLRASNSYANLPPGPQTRETYKWTKDIFVNYSGVEPDQFNKTSLTEHFYQPQGLGCYYAFPAFTAALTFYSPMGYYTDWHDTMAYGTGEIYGKNYQSLGILASQVTLAREIFDGFSAGVGVSLLYDRLQRKSEKVVSNSSILDYDYDYDMKVDGYGAEGHAGLLYRVCEWLSVGGVYRTGATVKMTGSTNTSLTLAGTAEDTHTTYKFRHPPTWGLGVAVKPVGRKLILTADFQQTIWSVYRTNVHHNQEGLLLHNTSYDEDWHNSDRLRFGCEYMLRPTWALRGGFTYDESPLPSKSVSMAHIPDVDRKIVTFGTGFQPAENWNIDLVGAVAWGDRHAREQKFEQRAWGLGVDATWHF
jgi:long-chain fatty acid transport protein